MLEQPQIYRLMNGMDGVTIDKEKVGRGRSLNGRC
jgi:hypothetical protein